jgi:hypothetical protein
LQGDVDDVPKVIQELYGKLFIFRFKLNEINVTEGIIQELYGKLFIFRFKLNEINVTEGRQGYLLKRRSSMMISLKKNSKMIKKTR